MTISIYERRRRNLQQLLDIRFRGNQAALARAIERSPSYVWRVLTDLNNENAKRLGEDLARLIERACRLEMYWLDQDHETQSVNVITTEGALSLRRPMFPRAIPIYDAESLVESGVSSRVQGSVVAMIFTDNDLGIDSFALVMRGQSMAAEICEGDKVLIDPALRPEAGDVVLARLRDQVTPVLRTYRPIHDGSPTFELAAANESYAAISSDRVLSIVGVMVEHHRYRRSGYVAKGTATVLSSPYPAASLPTGTDSMATRKVRAAG